LIIIDILSYQAGRRVAVVTICQDLGISEKSVRNTFRKLSQRKYMHRSYGTGMPSHYTFNGLKKLVEELARNRQAGVHDLRRGVRKKYSKSKQGLHTNKEANTNKYKKERNSYAQYLKDRDELAKKKSV
jgi:DNA-binding transcriptional regulator PaaX